MRWLRRLPLSVVFSAIALVYLVAGTALALWLATLLPQRWMAAALAVALLLPLLVYHVRRAVAPMNSLFRALAGTVAKARRHVPFDWYRRAYCQRFPDQP